MKIRGEVFKQRPYPKLWYNNNNCIFFLEAEHGVQVGEDRIKILPILSEELEVSLLVGERVEIEGEIQWKRIITPSGKLSFSPIPVFMMQDIEKLVPISKPMDRIVECV